MSKYDRDHNKHREKSRKFHDRVASKYDSIYDDAFWDFHDRITWNHLKPFLPTDPTAPVMDLGCGTGKWGLKLLKAGYPTTFSDLSQNMLQEVRKKRNYPMEDCGRSLAVKQQFHALCIHSVCSVRSSSQ